MPSRVGGPARSCLSAPQHAPRSLSAGEIFATTKRAYESLSRDREAVRGRTKWFPVTGGGGRPRAGHMARTGSGRSYCLVAAVSLLCPARAGNARHRLCLSPPHCRYGDAACGAAPGGRYVSCGSTGACDPVRRAVLYPAVARVPACRRHGACTGKGAPRRPVRPERPATHVARVIMRTAHVRPGSGRALPLLRSRSRSRLARAANKPAGWRRARPPEELPLESGGHAPWCGWLEKKYGRGWLNRLHRFSLRGSDYDFS